METECDEKRTEPSIMEVINLIAKLDGELDGCLNDFEAGLHRLGAITPEMEKKPTDPEHNVDTVIGALRLIREKQGLAVDRARALLNSLNDLV